MKKFLLLIGFFAFYATVLSQTLPNNWTGDSGIDTYKEATIVHGGSFSCKVVVNTGSQSSCDMRHSEISVTAGETYTFKFYGYTSEHVRIRAILEWTGASITYGNYLDANSGGWVEHTETGTVPSGATGVKVGVRFYDVSGFSAPETQYIDDFTFESPTGSPITLANGNMEDWPTSGVENPSGFSASAGGTDNIDLSWSLNANGDNVMIAYNTTDAFGTPTDGTSYTVGSTLSDGGTIIYNGNGTWFNHSGLNSNTTYYYKAWSVDGSNNYSSGVTANATTTKAEPTNHVTGFTATAASSSKIDLSWTENDGAVAPDGYLIKASTADNITDPTDGTEESDDTNLSDGSGAVNVEHGTTSYSWTGLSASTTYYFKIYPYTNSGSHIDYKTDGTVPSANATTQEQTPEYLIISEVADPSDNPNARFVEIYNVGNADINLTSGQWYLSRQANGGNWGDVQLTGTISPGEVMVIGYSQSNFNSAYGFDPDFTSGNISGNGDDGYFLYKGGDHSTGTLVDAYGVIDEDGTGKDWEYTDSRAYRKSTVTQANITWTSSEWVIESSDVAEATPGNYPEITDEQTIGGIGDYDFTGSHCALKMSVISITGNDNFRVKFYKGRGPKHAGGINESNVSKYGWHFIMGSGITAINANLKFYISQLPENSVTEGSDSIKLYKRETFGNGDFSLVGALTYHDNGTPGDQSDDWLEYDGITGFSEYVMASNDENLPVELTSFSATVSDNAVKLSWTTATEVNSYGFEIERTSVKNTWETLGFVEGAGNSNSPKEYSFVDNSVSNGKYTYRLKQIDLDGSYKYSKEIEVTIGAPTKFELAQNYPNPFNPTTTITYSIPSVIARSEDVSSRLGGATRQSDGLSVSLKVYDALGREVATLVNGKQTAGEYSVKFDASKLTSGIYFYTLRAGNFVQTRKMILMK